MYRVQKDQIMSFWMFLNLAHIQFIVAICVVILI